MRSTIGAGNGWVRLEDDDWPGQLYLRFERDERGRWRVQDLIFRGEWRHLVTADLRGLNLAAIEEQIQPELELLEMLPSRDNPPDLDGFVAGFGPPMPAQPEATPVPRLRRPTQGLTEDFLRHVADAYRQAVVDGKAPAPELARQVGEGATERTIHKWVYTARQRGILPPAARRRSQ